MLSYALAVTVGVAAVLGLFPGLARFVAEAVAVDLRTAQLALAALFALAAVWLGRRVVPHIDRWLHPERRALEEGAQHLLHELSAAEAPDEVARLLGDRIEGLLRPVSCVVYVRDGSRYAPLQSGAVGDAATFKAGGPLLQLLAREAQPVALRGGARRLRGLPEADRAVLASVDADVLLPVRRGADLALFVALGAKRSGDRYTSTDLTLLAAVAEQASDALLRMRDARILEQERGLVGELEQLKEAAERASRAKTRFLAAASHELRQPLHALGLFVEALRQRTTDPGVREVVDKVRATTGALGEMFDTLLDMSRLDAGAVEPSIVEFAVGPLLERLHAELTPQARATGIDLRTVPTRLVVRSDPILLRRIVQNLLSNALRYTGRGRVLVGCRRSRTHVRIEVHDTGPGIPLAQQEAIFGEFVRLAGDEGGGGAAQGLGLGLSIVQKMAALLGHPVALASQPGRGSTFAVTVPRGRLPATESADSSPTPLDLTARRILAIDDDPEILEATRRLLEQWGCRVAVASSLEDVAEGLDALGAPPDAVVADHRLAGDVTGFDVIAAVRRHSDRAVPAVVVTGNTDPDAVAAIRAHGFPLLSKPVAPARLRAALAELIDAASREPPAGVR
jgi:signal transduction histidine kinase/ActR/RegA family two-component response regulator